MNDAAIGEGLLLFQDEISSALKGSGFKQHGFTRRKRDQALVLAQIAGETHPITLRGVFYRAVSAGLYPDTSEEHYRACGYLLLQMRRRGIIPYDWIVDSTRRRTKPSSWSGLADYADTVAECYRRNFWEKQESYLEVFVEKDAMAAVIEPITEQWDVYLNVIRGCVSESFAWQVGKTWKQIQKPIVVYYLGDHDPAGLMIERDLRKRIFEFCKKETSWKRLAIDGNDFKNREILGFKIKGDRKRGAWQTRHRDYLKKFGDRCVEVDALSPNVIRGRLEEAIKNHVDMEEWKRLQKTEELEKETTRLVLAQNIQGAAVQS